MEILAGSAPEEGIWLHSGYTAAAIRMGDLRTPGAVIAGLGLAVAAAAIPKQRVALRVVWVVCGALLLGMGGCVFAVGQAFGEDPVKVTSKRISALQSECDKRTGRGETIPDDIEVVRTNWKLTRASTEDGWSRSMRIVRTGARVVVTSAGEDGQFGTADDISAENHPSAGGSLR